MPILNFELDYLINLHKLNDVGADIRRLCVVYFVGLCGAKSKMIDIDYLTLGLHNSSHLDQFSIYLLRNKYVIGCVCVCVCQFYLDFLRHTHFDFTIYVIVIV